MDDKQRIRKHTRFGLCIAAVFAMGLLGRPGILRVYVPVVSLLVIAPFLVGQFYSR